MLNNTFHGSTRIADIIRRSKNLNAVTRNILINAFDIHSGAVAKPKTLPPLQRRGAALLKGLNRPAFSVNDLYRFNYFNFQTEPAYKGEGTSYLYYIIY